MNENLCQTDLLGQLQTGKQVRNVAVDAVIGNQPKKMQSFAGYFELGKKFVQQRIFKKGTIFDGFINSADIVMNHSSRADIQVSDLRVARLPLR